MHLFDCYLWDQLRIDDDDELINFIDWVKWMIDAKVMICNKLNDIKNYEFIILLILTISSGWWYTSTQNKFIKKLPYSSLIQNDDLN